MSISSYIIPKWWISPLPCLIPWFPSPAPLLSNGCPMGMKPARTMPVSDMGRHGIAYMIYIYIEIGPYVSLTCKLYIIYIICYHIVCKHDISSIYHSVDMQSLRNPNMSLRLRYICQSHTLENMAVALLAELISCCYWSSH